MQQTVKASGTRVWLNKLKTTFSKPQNAILLALGILLTFSTIAPMISIALDTRNRSMSARWIAIIPG